MAGTTFQRLSGMNAYVVGQWFTAFDEVVNFKIFKTSVLDLRNDEEFLNILLDSEFEQTAYELTDDEGTFYRNYKYILFSRSGWDASAISQYLSDLGYLVALPVTGLFFICYFNAQIFNVMAAFLFGLGQLQI